MKKVIANILALVLVAALLLPAAAFATNEEPTRPPTESTQPDNPDPSDAPVSPSPTEKVITKPTITITPTPAELVEAGAVSLSIAVQNPNDFDLENVTLSIDGKSVKTLAAIAAGSTYNYTGKYSVEENKIGKKIPVKVAYDGGSASANIVIARKAATISVNTMTRVDKTAVEEGGKVNFSFSIENNSDVKIENATLKATTLNNGNSLGKAFTLAADGDATIVLFTATITQTIEVAPILTFEAAGKTYTKELETITITVNDANMEITATPSTLTPEEGEAVKVDLQIVNTGNVDFQDLELYDAHDQRVTTSTNRLAAGETLSAQHVMTFDKGGTYDFYIVVSDAAGTSYTYRSNALEIDLTAAAAQDLSRYFTLAATVEEEMKRLEKPQEVTFELAVKNVYTEAFRDVKIVEKNSGTVIETYSSFPVGEKILPYTVMVEKTTNFDFVMTATDPEGNRMEVRADRISINVETAKTTGTSKVTKWLLIFGIPLGILLIGAIVMLVILLMKNKGDEDNDPEDGTEGPTDVRRPARISRATYGAAAATAVDKQGKNDDPAPAAAESPEPDVPIYTRPAPRKSFEDLMAEPAAAATAAAIPQEDPNSAEEPEETKEPEIVIPPVPKRKRREFEDRNMF